MRALFLLATCGLMSSLSLSIYAQTAAPSTQQGQGESPVDPVKSLVGRLDLEKYKATIKGLTQFGDRRQGTDRNKAAIDWIEAQLESYGCTNTERIKYVYEPPPARGGTQGGQAAAGAGRGGKQSGHAVLPVQRGGSQREPADPVCGGLDGI